MPPQKIFTTREVGGWLIHHPLMSDVSAICPV